MLLLLVRHGLTPITGKRLTGWLPGYHLSHEGRGQADDVARRLEELPVAAVYSSPLERCRETAQPIARAHRLRVRTIRDLGEIDYGDWQGKTLKSLYRSKAWRELNARRGDFRFPGGETPREAQTRAVGAVEELLARHKGEPVVAVSHADLIRLIVAGYLGLGIDFYNRMTIGPASVTALALGGPSPRLLSLNHSGALDWLVKGLRDRPDGALPRRARVSR
ncbi:MAG: histidine phosphatase family protein [Actinomycetota bacterium]